MKKILEALLVWWVLFLLGCGESNQNLPKQANGEIPYDISPILAKFETDAKLHGKVFQREDFHFIVEDLEGDINGRCMQPGNIIKVDIDAWAEGPQAFRELLIYHELGHCFLHRDHIDSNKSIMNPHVGIFVDLWIIPAEKSKLIKELFTGE